MKMTAEQKTVLKANDGIFWNDWDPIGVNDTGEARDEYSSYADSATSRNLEALQA